MGCLDGNNSYYTEPVSINCILKDIHDAFSADPSAHTSSPCRQQHTPHLVFESHVAIVREPLRTSFLPRPPFVSPSMAHPGARRPFGIHAPTQFTSHRKRARSSVPAAIMCLSKLSPPQSLHVTPTSLACTPHQPNHGPSLHLPLLWAIFTSPPSFSCPSPGRPRALRNRLRLVLVLDRFCPAILLRDPYRPSPRSWIHNRLQILLNWIDNSPCLRSLHMVLLPTVKVWNLTETSARGC